MALTVGVRVGTRIQVGESVVVVADYKSGVVVLRVNDERLVVVTADERALLLPDVYVFLGESESASTGRRLAFEAPRSIVIRRQP